MHARQRIITLALSVASAAKEVGRESASRFICENGRLPGPATLLGQLTSAGSRAASADRVRLAQHAPSPSRRGRGLSRSDGKAPAATVCRLLGGGRDERGRGELANQAVTTVFSPPGRTVGVKIAETNEPPGRCGRLRVFKPRARLCGSMLSARCIQKTGEVRTCRLISKAIGTLRIWRRSSTKTISAWMEPATLAPT